MPLKPLSVRWPKPPKLISEWDHKIPHVVPEGLILMARKFKNPLTIQLYCEIDRACRIAMTREGYPLCDLTVQDFAKLLDCSDQRILRAFALLSEYRFVVGFGNYSYSTDRYDSEIWYFTESVQSVKKKKKEVK